MLLACLVLALMGLIVGPVAAALLVWARQRPARPFPLAVVGAALMLLSFLALPWLSFDPLRYAGLDWVYDVVPLAQVLIERLGLDDLGRALPLWRAVRFLAHPPGWLALALGVGPLTWLAVLLLGAVAFAAAQAVTWLPRPRLPAGVLLAATLALLLLLLFDLAVIDGLGEHGFPHPLTVIQPFLAVHLAVLGPASTVVALGLQIVAAALALQRGEKDAAWDDEMEGS